MVLMVGLDSCHIAYKVGFSLGYGVISRQFFQGEINPYMAEWLDNRPNLWNSLFYEVVGSIPASSILLNHDLKNPFSD